MVFKGTIYQNNYSYISGICFNCENDYLQYDNRTVVFEIVGKIIDKNDFFSYGRYIYSVEMATRNTAEILHNFINICLFVLT